MRRLKKEKGAGDRSVSVFLSTYGIKEGLVHSQLGLYCVVCKGNNSDDGKKGGYGVCWPSSVRFRLFGWVHEEEYYSDRYTRERRGRKEGRREAYEKARGKRGGGGGTGRKERRGPNE